MKNVRYKAMKNVRYEKAQRERAKAEKKWLATISVEWLACAMNSGDGPNSYATIKLLHAMLEVKRLLEAQVEKQLEDQR